MSACRKILAIACRNVEAGPLRSLRRSYTSRGWLRESCAAPAVDISAERRHFEALDVIGRESAIRDLAVSGASDYAIAAATRLSVEQVRRVLADVAVSS